MMCIIPFDDYCGVYGCGHRLTLNRYGVVIINLLGTLTSLTTTFQGHVIDAIGRAHGACSVLSC